MKTIELEVGSKKAFYNDKEKIIKTFLKDVEIICTVPSDWALTRVLQFMESLLDAELS